LRIVQQLQDAAFHEQFLELDGRRNVSFIAQPNAEGVQRPNVGVDRHRPDAALPLVNHERLKAGLRGQRRRVVCERGAIVFECDPIPNQRRGRDVLEVSALFQELIDQRCQRVVHGSLQTVWRMELVRHV
jgi:hypothetical protein